MFEAVTIERGKPNGMEEKTHQQYRTNPKLNGYFYFYGGINENSVESTIFQKEMYIRWFVCFP